MTSWDDVRYHPLVVSALVGTKKISSAPTKRARALRPPELATLVRRATDALKSKPDSSASYNLLLAAAIATLGFIGVMRLGELTEAPAVEDRADARKVAARRSVVMVKNSEFHFTLDYHKGDRFFPGSSVVIVAETPSPSSTYQAPRDVHPLPRPPIRRS